MWVASCDTEAFMMKGLPGGGPLGRLPGGGNRLLDRGGGGRGGARSEFREGACEEEGGAGAGPARGRRWSPSQLGTRPTGPERPGAPFPPPPRRALACSGADPAPRQSVPRCPASGEATASGSAGFPAPGGSGARRAAPAAAAGRAPGPELLASPARPAPRRQARAGVGGAPGAESADISSQP
ncbi:translation initiation factor IF-2-like [Camelus ferus]|uniref:Translation initiation factor IF-2-like n=1 Tax=Camelus ferus TaxID=419612 RepID=A0A8B8T359_CAMFR|nr:translation initiation factor IF-2-like [Camelus ferus]